MKISVGNIPQSMTEDSLKKLFSEFGTVEDITIKRDKKTKVSLGYGHVEMSDESAKKAIEGLNGKDLEGKTLAVLDSDQVQKDFKDKNFEKNQSTTMKLYGNKSTSGFGGGSTVRRVGGGGRGK